MVTDERRSVAAEYPSDLQKCWNDNERLVCPRSWSLGLTPMGWVWLKYSPLPAGLGLTKDQQWQTRYDGTSAGVTGSKVSWVDVEPANALE